MIDELATSERILVLAPRGRDAELARMLLGRHQFTPDVCDDVNAVIAKLSEGAGCAIVTQESLAGGIQARLAAALATQPAWSDFPMIVLANGTHPVERQLGMLADLGNVTLLDRPVTGQTLIAALRAALRARRRQYDARAAIQQRDQFLAMLGHELRNPLGAIVLATELMSAPDARPEEVADRVRMIARQAQHLARLVDDLLDVARVTSGKVRLRREPVDVDDTIRSCVEALAAFARERSIRVTFVAGARAIVDGDAVRLEQVFSNLLTNAIKYSPDGRSVTVSTSVVEDECEIRVRDEGIGIESEMLPRIFELFTQADGTLERSAGGMGIGLTLVKRLVELHGGTVAVNSAGLGIGSEFVVRLPIRAEVSRPFVKVRAPLAPQGPAGSVSVVLVDDNDDIRELSCMLLQTMDCTVEVAADGIEGVAQILGTRPELAFIDIGLPGLDGFAVAQQVRATLGDAPLLVAVTGYGQPHDREQAIAAGFDAHLTKPVQASALRAMVDRARQARLLVGASR